MVEWENKVQQGGMNVEGQKGEPGREAKSGVERTDSLVAKSKTNTFPTASCYMHDFTRNSVLRRLLFVVSDLAKSLALQTSLRALRIG